MQQQMQKAKATLLFFQDAEEDSDEQARISGVSSSRVAMRHMPGLPWFPGSLDKPAELPGKRESFHFS